MDNTYIMCDCSDCGFSRIRGPCLLETIFKNKDHITMDGIRTDQQNTNEYKAYVHMCETIAGSKTNFVSVNRVSVV